MYFMTEQDWNEVDRTSREEMILLLSCQISADNIFESVGNCSFDISANINGKRVGMELKDRNCDLTSYGDMMITDYKHDCNIRRLGKDFDKFLIVSFYRDNTMALCEIRDRDMKILQKYCNFTTLVKGQSNKKVSKTCYIYPQRICLKKTSEGWKKMKKGDK